MKIGITTHYYNSNNYGGNLQAFALCKVLEKHGNNVEQICYSIQAKKSLLQVLKEKGLVCFVKSAIKRFVRIFKGSSTKIVPKEIEGRKQKILEFNHNIPHSDEVYNADTIEGANDKYDLFITGSDQVWHPSAINKAYSLEFVKGKRKISYAASVSVDHLDDRQKGYYKSFLKDFSAVSVREQKTVALLNELSPIEVKWVLDPTMLLEENEWLQMLESCNINDKFLFCYFLGNDKAERERAKEFAKSKGLIIVDIPHLQGVYEKEDDGFADVSVFDASPGQFLWLIKNAQYVFTDSFHSTVFSLIFKKQFYVFERAKHKGMGERIRSLLSLFDTNERFITDDKNKDLDYILSLKEVDYVTEFAKFKRMQEYSINFLLDNVEK